MQVLAVLPIVTAALAAGCVLRPVSSRMIWLVVAVAGANVLLMPLTSGEWFYQREEDASYDQAVARGDFTDFDALLARHDPHLQPRMISVAVALLVALVMAAVLKIRANQSKSATAARAVATVAVLVAAAAGAVQGITLLVSG